MSKANYNSRSIKVLEGLEAVRVRPGMYIGSTSSKGLHHLIWEVVDNSIDEALAGFCTKIVVTHHKDGYMSIADNGRGIPVGQHSTGKNTLEVVMTVLHAGGKFDNNNYQYSGGLHGVGISVVNALSSHCVATICRDNTMYEQEFSCGTIKTPLKVIKKGIKERGTTIKFKPDASIFDNIKFNNDIIRTRLKELSYLNKGLEIVYIDEKSGNKDIYKSNGGLVDYIKEITSKNFIMKPISLDYRTSIDGQILESEIVIAYGEQANPVEVSFVNNIPTVDGGTHIVAFRSAFTKIINQIAREKGLLKDKDDNFTGNDIREGLVLLLSIKLPDPQFESQTKDKLGSEIAGRLVSNMVVNELKTKIEKSKELSVVIDKIKLLVKAKAAAKLAKELVLNKNKAMSNPTKLSSCSSKNPKECEIYLVEGDSAGGSAKQGRDRKIQAILPLRGKVLNINKADADKIRNNQELKNIILSLGCGISDSFNIDNLRYHKIIIMTDSDVDGMHIKSLLLTFFYKFMPELIKRGHLYIANPPLYKITSGNKTMYALDDIEKDSITNKLTKSNKIFALQRYKGLGEMNPEQLWDTAMNPANRTLTKVTIVNKKKAEDMVELLMGNDVAPRRDYIEKNRQHINLEILD